MTVRPIVGSVVSVPPRHLGGGVAGIHVRMGGFLDRGPGPSLSGSVGVQMCTSTFSRQRCYRPTWPAIHSISLFSSADSG